MPARTNRSVLGVALCAAAGAVTLFAWRVGEPSPRERLGMAKFAPPSRASVQAHLEIARQSADDEPEPRQTSSLAEEQVMVIEPSVDDSKPPELDLRPGKLAWEMQI